MTKIAFIGAGSTVFAKNLFGDILSFPELSDATISLMDIDPVRLQTSEVVAHKVAEFFEAKPTIEATLDRRRALLFGSRDRFGVKPLFMHRRASWVLFGSTRAFGTALL